MLGIFSKTTDSAVIESLRFTKFDFVIIDREHGYSSFETVANHIRALKNSTCKSVVRVSSLNHNEIGTVLDLGADGVQVPNISTVDEAKQVIQAARFHPLGSRGVCRFVTAADYGTKDRNEYFKSSNTKLLILQVEGQEGISNIDEILNLEGYDILFIGPYDLSQSLGVPGDINNSLVQDELVRVKEKSTLYGKKVGAFCDTIENAKMLQRLGYDYIAYSVDINIFINGCNQIISNINNVE